MPERARPGAAPLVVTADAGRAAELADRHRRAGWTILAGWRPALVAGWNLVPERVVCTGEIASRDDAADAVVMAARGAGVIGVARCDPAVLALLVDDLRQLGEVELDLADASDEVVVLEADQLRLLRLIARGATVTDAADALHLSRRTAARRLADARERLGVTTTVEAADRIARGDDRRSGPAGGAHERGTDPGGDHDPSPPTHRQSRTNPPKG